MCVCVCVYGAYAASGCFSSPQKPRLNNNKKSNWFFSPYLKHSQVIILCIFFAIFNLLLTLPFGQTFFFFFSKQGDIACQSKKRMVMEIRFGGWIIFHIHAHMEVLRSPCEFTNPDDSRLPHFRQIYANYGSSSSIHNNPLPITETEVCFLVFSFP